jgi:hypothetical protein
MSGAFFTIGMTASFEVSFRNNVSSRRGFRVLFPASLFLPEEALPQGEDFAAGKLAELVSMWFTDSPQYQIPDRLSL